MPPLPYLACVRVALLSMTGRAGDDLGAPLAELAFAGRSLAERQLDLALALGCERIVCLAEGLDKSLVALQLKAEAAEAKFNLVAGPRALLGLVSANDELVVLADGLLPTAHEAEEALAGGNCVLVLPVEAGIAAGFERIDLNYAWAGALSMPGRLVERLAQLPPDCDPVSALLRIALQGRIPERELPERLLTDRQWSLIATEAQLAELEPEWLRRHVARPNPFAPGRGLARFAIRNMGARLLATGWKPIYLVGAGLGLGVAAIVGAVFGYSVLALLVYGLGWMIAEAGIAFASLAAAGAGNARMQDRTGPMAGVLLDFCLVVVLAASLPGNWLDRGFTPLVLLGLARLCGRSIGTKWSEFSEDRAALAVLLAIAASAALLLPVIQLLALGLIFTLLAMVRIKTG